MNKFIPLSAMKKILKEEGAKVISNKAAKKMTTLVESYAREIAKKSIKKALFSGRKTIKQEDFN